MSEVRMIEEIEQAKAEGALARLSLPLDKSTPEGIALTRLAIEGLPRRKWKGRNGGQTQQVAFRRGCRGKLRDL